MLAFAAQTRRVAGAGLAAYASSKSAAPSVGLSLAVLLEVRSSAMSRFSVPSTLHDTESALLHRDIFREPRQAAPLTTRQTCVLAADLHAVAFGPCWEQCKPATLMLPLLPH